VLLQSLAAHTRDAACFEGAGGPPPFIPFAQRGRVDNTSKRGISLTISNILFCVFSSGSCKTTFLSAAEAHCSLIEIGWVGCGFFR